MKTNNIFQLLEMEKTEDRQKIKEKYTQRKNEILLQQGKADNVFRQIYFQNKLIELDDAYLLFQTCDISQ